MQIREKRRKGEITPVKEVTDGGVLHDLYAIMH